MASDIIGKPRPTGEVIIGHQRSSNNYHHGLVIRCFAMACCGLSTIENFGTLTIKTHDDKAALLAELYKANPYAKHYLYTITDAQLKYPEHQLLLEIGARELTNFPNLAHGPSILHIFEVNIQKACGTEYLTTTAQPKPEKKGTEEKTVKAPKVPTKKEAITFESFVKALPK